MKRFEDMPQATHENVDSPKSLHEEAIGYYDGFLQTRHLFAIEHQKLKEVVDSALADDHHPIWEPVSEAVKNHRRECIIVNSQLTAIKNQINKQGSLNSEMEAFFETGISTTQADLDTTNEYINKVLPIQHR